MSVHTHRTEMTNANVSKTFVWTCEIETWAFSHQRLLSTATVMLCRRQKRCTQHFEEPPVISSLNRFPERAGDQCFSNIKILWIKIWMSENLCVKETDQTFLLRSLMWSNYVYNSAETVFGTDRTIKPVLSIYIAPYQNRHFLLGWYYWKTSLSHYQQQEGNATFPD